MHFLPSNIISWFSILAYYCFCGSILLGQNLILTLIGSLCATVFPLYRTYQTQHLNVWTLTLSVFMIVGAFMNTMISTNGIGGCLVIAGVISMADYIVRNPAKMLVHARNMYIVYVFVFSYLILLKEIDPNEIYIGMSRNYLGLILVFFHVFYCFLLYITQHKFNFLILIPSVILAVTFVGRSSIGAIGMLLIIHLFILLRSVHFIYKLLIVALISIIVYNNFSDLELLYLASSFNGHGLDTPRYEIWSQFFHKSDLFTYILGMDTLSIPLIAEYFGNVHNGFINILARTGIGFSVFLILFIYSLHRIVKYRDFFILSLLVIISFRTFFDTGIFIGNLGFIFYSVLLYPLSDSFTIHYKNLKQNNLQQ